MGYSVKMNSPLSIEVKNLNHLGIIAGIIDEIGLVDQINKILGQHPQEKVSAGQAAKAMILNGLGFVSGTLYPGFRTQNCHITIKWRYWELSLERLI